MTHWCSSLDGVLALEIVAASVSEPKNAAIVLLALSGLAVRQRARC